MLGPLESFPEKHNIKETGQCMHAHVHTHRAGCRVEKEKTEEGKDEKAHRCPR
jgi:hypothetical protein